MYAAENWEEGESCSAPSRMSLRGYGGVWEKGRVQVGACVLTGGRVYPVFPCSCTVNAKQGKNEADLGMRLT